MSIRWWCTSWALRRMIFRKTSTRCHTYIEADQRSPVRCVGSLMLVIAAAAARGLELPARWRSGMSSASRNHTPRKPGYLVATS